ncbi:MAG: hypothetical protein AB7I59_25640 [Geminicoccaceae bacterium]
MEDLGIQYFDGFSGKTNARLDPAVYGLDIYYPGDVAEGRVRRFDKFLQFYKLHGSIHWQTDKSGIIRARHRDLGRRYLRRVRPLCLGVPCTFLPAFRLNCPSMSRGAQRRRPISKRNGGALYRLATTDAFPLADVVANWGLNVAEVSSGVSRSAPAAPQESSSCEEDDDIRL